MLNYNFDSFHLKEAISNTFVNRGTEIQNYKYIFSSEFKNSKEKNSQWQAFIRKIRLDTVDRFDYMIEHIQDFLDPPINSILNNSHFDLQWIQTKQMWTKI